MPGLNLQHPDFGMQHTTLVHNLTAAMGRALQCLLVKTMLIQAGYEHFLRNLLNLQPASEAVYSDVDGAKYLTS